LGLSEGRAEVRRTAAAGDGRGRISETRRQEEDELPLRYDAEKISRYWNRRRGEMTARWQFFLGMALPFGGRLVKGYTQGTLTRDERELARELRTILEKMGPTFVKLGQILSIRPDIVGEATIAELSKLQDAVPPFPVEQAIQVIEEELSLKNLKFSDVFCEFPTESIASASLASVFRAKLKQTGEWVAVKVQRPGLLPVVTKDLYVMKRAAEWNQQVMTRFTKQKTNYVAMLETWANGFYTELDFANEARNQQM